MSQKRLSMRKIEEILRLKYEAKLPHRAIAQSCGISPSTVSDYLARAQAAGLGWPLPEGLSAAELEEKLFPAPPPAAERHTFRLPKTVRATEKTVEIFYQRTRQASHPRSAAQGRYSTQPEHMPPAHQQMSDWSPERFQRWAAEMGPHTTQLITMVLDGRQHPEQAYRTCLGILGLGKRYTAARLEAACRRALALGILSYKGVRNILANKLDQLADPTPADPSPLPSHANIRGEGYYH
jgi:transposase